MRDRTLYELRRTVWWAAAIVCLLHGPAAAQTPTFTSGPVSGTTTVLPAKDYASFAWQDAWDMDRRTDIGWMTWGIDQPTNNMASKGMAGCTSGVTGCQTFTFLPDQTGQPLYFLLDSWAPGSSPVGKIGLRHPIDTTQFKYLLIKMRMTNAVAPTSYASLGPPQFVVYWSRDTIYRTNPDGSTRQNGGVLRSLTNNGTVPGILLDTDGIEASQWQIYAIDLTSLQWWNESKNPSAITPEPSSSNWGQSGITADSFFIQAINWPGSVTGSMDVDWVQLTETPGPGGAQAIKWSGGNTQYDIVLSPSSNCFGANSLSPDYTVLAENVSRSSGLTFPMGALPAGTYYVGLRVSGNDGPGIPRGSLAACSAGHYVVPSQSSLAFVTPTDQGSTDDFATVYLNNPWDFNAMTDIDWMNGVQSPQIDPAFPAQRPEGDNLGNINVFRGTALGNGDPYIYTFWFQGRGKDQRIDPHRYRILTVDMGLDANRDVNAGSIMRMYWHVSGDQDANGVYLENTTEDLIIRHLPAASNGGLYVLDRIQGDLLNVGSIPPETDPVGPPSRSCWTSSCVSPYCTTPPAHPGIDGFRIDFYELPQSGPASIKQARLASLERTGASYAISYVTSTPNIAGATATLKLYAVAANVQPALRGTIRNPIDPSCNPNTAGVVLLNGAGTAVTLGASQPGQFVWQPGQTPGITAYNGNDGSGEYYVCGVVQMNIGGTVMTTAMMLTQFPILVDPSFVTLPRLYMDKSVLHFAAVYDRPSNSFIAATPDQTVSVVQSGAGATTWQASLLQPDGTPPAYMRVLSGSGNGNGAFTIGFNPSGLVPSLLPDCTAQDGMSSVLTLSSGGTTSDDPQTLEVYLTIKPSAATTCTSAQNTPPAPPFGTLDAPANNSTGVVGAIAVSGWALDDIGVQRVEIYRNCAGPIDTSRSACVAAVPGGAADKVFVGDGAFVPGARPDVEAAFPTKPMAYRAGWGFLMLTNGFPDLVTNQPNGGQGTFTVFAYAVDVEGSRTLLGQKTISLDNDHSTIPFGSIDTPGQSDTVPGAGAYANPNAYPNFGWALTQAGKCLDPTNPNAYQVYIDGVRRALVQNSNWYPGLDRSDISSAFPGLCNSHSAVAAYILNVGALGLTSGLHTIGWTVTDTAGQSAGIGSRFFSVAPGSGASSVARSAPVDRNVGLLADAVDLIPAVIEPLIATRAGGPGTTVGTDVEGRLHVRADQMERLQIDLPDARGGWSAYAVDHGRLWVLPVGASFDSAAGRLAWQPPPGLSGDFRLLFVRNGADGRPERADVTVSFGLPAGDARAARLAPPPAPQPLLALAHRN